MSPWYPRWQTVFEVSQAERADGEHWVCPISLEWQHRPTCVKRTNKDSFPLLSSASREALAAFPDRKSQPVPDRTHSERLLSSTLSVSVRNYFLSKQTGRGGYRKHRRAMTGAGGLGLALSGPQNWTGCGKPARERHLKFRKSLNTQSRQKSEATDWNCDPFLCKAL